MDAASDDDEFLNEAVTLAVRAGSQGKLPFASVIVREGAIIAAATNNVVPQNDVTAHAEIAAIRKASSALASHVLHGCMIYCSCEPCLMCAGAIVWARLSAVVYAAPRELARRYGFFDRAEPSLGRSILAAGHCPVQQGIVSDRELPFERWAHAEKRQQY